MNKVRRYKTRTINRIILIVMSVLIFLLLTVMLYSSALETYFNDFISWLSSVEIAISQLESDFLILLCIIALFVAKCYLPLPLTFLCIISGMVYETRIAFAINLAAIVMVITLKYWEGRIIGGGLIERALNLRGAKTLRKMIHFKGEGNPYALFGFRLAPIISINTTSRIYGSLKFDFAYYIAISVAGLLPRIYTYTRIGHAMFNPFSPEFIMLIILLVVLVGVSAIVFNTSYGNKINQQNEVFIFAQKKPKYKIVVGE